MPNWEFYIPTVYQVGTTTSGEAKIYTSFEVFNPNAMYSGTVGMDAEASFGATGIYPTMFVDGQKYIDVEYITEPSITSSYAVDIEYVPVSGTSPDSVNITDDIKISPIGLINSYDNTDIWSRLAYRTEIVTNDTPHEVRLYRVFGKFIDDVDVIFSVPDYRKFYMWTDLVNVAEDSINIVADMEEGGGRSSFCKKDVHNALMSMHTTRSGIYLPGETTYSGIRVDVYSSVSGTSHHHSDVNDSILFNVCRYIGTTATVSGTTISGATTSGTTSSGGYVDPVPVGTIISGYSYYGLLNDFSFHNPIFTTTASGVTVSGTHINNEYIRCTTESGGGRTNNITNEIYCMDFKRTDVKSDFRLYSLSLVDFYLDDEEFTQSTDPVWIDVVDYLYPINTSNTYISVNGNRMPVTFSGIDVSCQDIVYGCNGTVASGQAYRVYYDPGDTFLYDDAFTISLHAENVFGDTLDRDFVMLYGYDVAYNDYQVWDANTQYYVWSKASNLAFCPNEGTGEFYFVTRELPSISLNATIKPVVPVDLGASIYPQSTAFFYGKTYSITVSGVKDFYGNEMASFTYSFTLEDPTN